MSLERAWLLGAKYSKQFEGFNVYDIHKCWEWWSKQKKSEWRVPLDEAEVEEAIQKWQPKRHSKDGG